MAPSISHKKPHDIDGQRDFTITDRDAARNHPYPYLAITATVDLVVKPMNQHKSLKSLVELFAVD